MKNSEFSDITPAQRQMYVDLVVRDKMINGSALCIPSEGITVNHPNWITYVLRALNGKAQ